MEVTVNRLARTLLEPLSDQEKEKIKGRAIAIALAHGRHIATVADVRAALMMVDDDDFLPEPGEYVD